MKITNIQKFIKSYDLKKGRRRKILGDPYSIKGLKCFVAFLLSDPQLDYNQDLSFYNYLNFMNSNNLIFDFSEKYLESGSLSARFFKKWKEDFIDLKAAITVPEVKIAPPFKSTDLDILQKLKININLHAETKESDADTKEKNKESKKINTSLNTKLISKPRAIPINLTSDPLCKDLWVLVNSYHGLATLAKTRRISRLFNAIPIDPPIQKNLDQRSYQFFLKSLPDRHVIRHSPQNKMRFVRHNAYGFSFDMPIFDFNPNPFPKDVTPVEIFNDGPDGFILKR